MELQRFELRTLLLIPVAAWNKKEKDLKNTRVAVVVEKGIQIQHNTPDVLYGTVNALEESRTFPLLGMSIFIHDVRLGVQQVAIPYDGPIHKMLRPNWFQFGDVFKIPQAKEFDDDNVTLYQIAQLNAPRKINGRTPLQRVDDSLYERPRVELSPWYPPEQSQKARRRDTRLVKTFDELKQYESYEVA